MKKTVQVEVGGRPLILETGHAIRQASGSVFVRYGDTVVMVAAVKEDRVREGIDFVPLMVEYQEMSYAAGRIPGGFFRREVGRPSEKETLTSRLIDRPIRPLFPKGYFYETQVIATVLSVDQENEPDVAAMTGASAALHISNIPFAGPIAAVRVGRVDGKFIVNPTTSQLEQSDMNVVVAGSRDAVVMVEGGAQFVPEDDMLEAIDVAHKAILPLLDAQDELRRLVGKPKDEIPEPVVDSNLEETVRQLATEEMAHVMTIADKLERRDAKKALKQRVLEAVAEQFPEQHKDVEHVLEVLEKEIVRGMMVRERRRIDGRAFDEIRPLSIEASPLPRTHGSALFRRGETQVLAVTTLGSSSDEQKIEALTGETFKSFMLHYNFPPYCVGEVRPLRGPSRREIGHGALAERAVRSILPSNGEFPYTIRVVCEVLESNGSSSMASVCSACLALMDAGVPVSEMVAGIAMGLVKEGDDFIILSDILGDEDHLGDMDFKVTGNERGITAIQMDVKIPGITREIMKRALAQARDGRLYILGKMRQVLSEPRSELSPYAPRMESIQINPDKIRDVIGPGGKMIRSIVAETGAKIDIEDSGRVVIMSPDKEACQKAIDKIRALTQEPEVGQVYMARVTKVTDFGAFAEILPNTDGLIHISQLDHKRVQKVTDVVKEGDEVLVKVIDIDREGRVRLSRKAVLEKPQGRKKS
ncbi:polyribonucleotide nucleotidyltransferase [Desulfacinum hydrothermale DSM 13146]|uniref:Polyribonucleotide nucleotidyltransferase n=1 Tax=Desulfacinum hydrothermale DSM 13146 TaxID=1121390 RepID=A0A1W1XA48_9BACT|nr:polyribonucleotide nucleotidyltransferase [Desulfacinum hydrothermale]SMC20411.1 polyribonucleotide nucleotidyltransferase [Desulfacinum hydrothermale DSM 13146]